MQEGSDEAQRTTTTDSHSHADAGGRMEAIGLDGRGREGRGGGQREACCAEGEIRVGFRELLPRTKDSGVCHLVG